MYKKIAHRTKHLFHIRPELFLCFIFRLQRNRKHTKKKPKNVENREIKPKTAKRRGRNTANTNKKKKQKNVTEEINVVVNRVFVRMRRRRERQKYRLINPVSGRVAVP